MAKIVYAPSGGAVVGLNPKLLNEAVGVSSMNQNPTRGDLRPWRQPLDVAAVPSGRGTIYRMGRDVASDALYWLSWPGVVHAIHGFISGDATERTYYTGDGAPKVTNNVIGLATPPYPSAFRQLGVPVPASAPVVTPKNTGVSTQQEYRYYTYTYVTDFGEESAPAPVSLQVKCKSDDTLTITNIEVPPAGTHGINRVRIYRTQTGQQGDTEFFFLREEVSTIGTTTDDNRALGEVLPTDGWLPPPATLKYLTSMWNGMAAAINTVDGSVRYCVAYKPYAWPIEFETLPPDAKAVALATFGQRLLVLTNGNPVLVTGSSPDSLDEQPLEINQSCIAPQSVVSFGHGVAWACPDGLIYYGEGGVKLLTSSIMTREDWQAINPSSIVGAIYEGSYLCSYTQAGVKKGFLIDPVNPTGIYFLERGFDAAYYDKSQDALYVLDDAKIKKWDAGAALMTAGARSKVFVSTERNYQAARVEANAYPVTVSFDALSLAGEQVAKRVVDRPGIFSAPTATSLRYTKTALNSRPFTLPAGFLAREYQVAISTTNPVQWVAVATSMDELAEG